MDGKPAILAFSGSSRCDSCNQRLVKIAARGVEQAGAAVTVFNLRDYPMPFYDGDLQAAEGIPDTAMALKRLFLAHQGLLIASPEYNSSLGGVLKNPID